MMHHKTHVRHVDRPSSFATSHRARDRWWFITASAVVCATLLIAGIDTAQAAQDDDGKDQSSTPQQQEIEKQIDELGITIRAAVMSGAIDGAEGREIYKAMMEMLKEDWVAAGAAAKGGNADALKGAGDREDTPKLRVLRLSAPEVGQLSALFEPELRLQDLTILRDELELDSDQMMIAEALLAGYIQALDLGSSALRESRKRYRQAEMSEWLEPRIDRMEERLADAVQRARSIDGEAATERLKRQVEQSMQDRLDRADDRNLSPEERREAREKADAWVQRMIVIAGELDARLESLHQRAEKKRAELADGETKVTANDLVRMANELRYERTQQMEILQESLRAVISDQQAGANNKRFNTALARARINRQLAKGRLGGESMNLWMALDEAKRTAGESVDLRAVEALLSERALDLAAALTDRGRATLDREIRGLEFAAQADRAEALSDNSAAGRGNNADDKINALRPFAAAARYEVDTAEIVRNTNLALLEESTTLISQMYPTSDLAEVYRNAALKRGFPAEMRSRWSERVVPLALGIEGLDSSQRNALLTIQDQNRVDLAALRQNAISKCIGRDPTLARQFITAAYGGDEQQVEWKPEMWLGLNHDMLDAIDERTDVQLRNILTPEQAETLPMPKRTPKAESKRDDRGKARGKSDSKGDGKKDW